MAGAVFLGWGALWAHGLWGVHLGGAAPTPIWDIAGTVVALEYAYTGLFILAHDALHGNVLHKNKAVNEWVGRVSLFLYAAFDYNQLYAKHWEHHDNTGCVCVHAQHLTSNCSWVVTADGSHRFTVSSIKTFWLHCAACTPREQSYALPVSHSIVGSTFNVLAIHVGSRPWLLTAISS
jgi:fatty acid desaturase